MEVVKIKVNNNICILNEADVEYFLITNLFRQLTLIFSYFNQ